MENQNYLLFDLLILTFNLIYAKTLCLSLIENGTDFGLCSHRYISIAPTPTVQKFSLFQKVEKFKTNKSNQKICGIIIIDFQNCVINKEKSFRVFIAVKTTSLHMSRQLVKLTAGRTKIQP